MADDCYDTVTALVDDVVTATDLFYGHAQQYIDLAAADGTGVDRSHDRTVETWIAAEEARLRIDRLVAELGATATYTITDYDSGESVTETAPVQSLQQFLHCTRDGDTLRNALTVDPPARYTDADVDAVLDAMEDEYDRLADANRTYLQALETLTGQPAITRSKQDAAAFTDTMPEQEYREITDILLEQPGDGPTAAP